MVTTTASAAANSLSTHTTHVPHVLPTLSTDASILVVVIAVVVYAVFAGFIPLTRLAAGVYIGLVVVASFGATVYHWTQGGVAGGSSAVNRSMVQLALFILPLALVQIGHPLRSHTHRVNMVFLLILGAMTALLVIAGGLSVLDGPALQTTLDQSNLASQIYNLRLPLIAAVPIAMAAAALFHRHPRRH
jgi:hypothetical protein